MVNGASVVPYKRIEIVYVVCRLAFPDVTSVNVIESATPVFESLLNTISNVAGINSGLSAL